MTYYNVIIIVGFNLMLFYLYVHITNYYENIEIIWILVIFIFHHIQNYFPIDILFN